MMRAVRVLKCYPLLSEKVINDLPLVSSFPSNVAMIGDSFIPTGAESASLQWVPAGTVM